MTGHRQLAAAAQRESIDGGNRRLWRRLESPEDFLPPTCQALAVERAEARQLADVCAGDESPTGARENDATDVAAVEKLADGRSELADGTSVQRVELIRAIDRERRNLV